MHNCSNSVQIKRQSTLLMPWSTHQIRVGQIVNRTQIGSSGLQLQPYNVVCVWFFPNVSDSSCETALVRYRRSAKVSLYSSFVPNTLQESA